MNKADFLAQVSLFYQMARTDLDLIAALTESHVFQPGAVIIREGERDRRLFTVVSGEVEVIKNRGEENERRLAVFGPSCYFGEMSLIDDLVRSATVVALTHTETLSLGQAGFYQALAKCPSMALELLRTLSQRVRAMEKALTRTLGGLLPICASCKSIRCGDDVWQPIEKYIENHSEADFTHGICPECARRFYPRLFQSGAGPGAATQ
jgi:CRP-like cAMP-binding protein